MAAGLGSEALAEADWSELEALEEEIARTELRLAELSRQRDERLRARRSSPTISLYDWQLEALAAWEDAGHRGVVQAVTGTGKTRVGLAAIDNARRAGRQSVVIVPTLALVKQWIGAIAELLPQARVRARRRPDQPWDVMVTTVQSAMRHPAQTRSGGLVVADECHRYGAETFKYTLRCTTAARPTSTFA